MSTLIRFVGGPWHNRFEDIDLRPVVVVRQALPSTTLSYGGVFAAAKIKEDAYYLARYQTHRRTLYYQYVHSTLVRNGKAYDCTFKERLPAWNIDRRKFEARLRRAMSSRS